MNLANLLIDIFVSPVAFIVAVYMIHSIEIDDFKSVVIAGTLITAANVVAGQFLHIIAPYVGGGIAGFGVILLIYAIPILVVCSFIPGIRIPDLQSLLYVSIGMGVALHVVHMFYSAMYLIAKNSGAAETLPKAGVS